MNRVTIYARISTREQNPELQLVDLRNYVRSRGLSLVAEYIDNASGSKSDRANYQKLLDDASKIKPDKG